MCQITYLKKQYILLFPYTFFKKIITRETDQIISAKNITS